MNNYLQKKAISSHGINIFLNQTPKEYKIFIDQENKKQQESHQAFGEMLHTHLIEPNEFSSKYHVIKDGKSVPTGKIAKLIEYIVAIPDYTEKDIEKGIAHVGLQWKLPRVLNELKKDEYQSYVNLAAQTVGKTIVPAEDYSILTSIQTNILHHKTAKRLLSPEDNVTVLDEQEVFWKNGIGQDCKARIDKTRINPYKREIELVEVKSTSRALKHFKYEIKKYGYHRQLAWYINEALPVLLESYGMKIHDFNPPKNRIIACLTTFPYLVRVIELDDIDIIEGTKDCDYATRQIQWHTDNDWWEDKEYVEKEEWIDHISLFNNPKEEYD